MKTFASLMGAGVVFILFSVTVHAQDASTTQSPEARLIAARALYYTPTDKGLKAFQCDVSVDWKEMLTRFSKSVIADNNPFLVYLQGVKMSASDDLNGYGKLTWTDTSAPPSNLQSNANSVRGGIIQAIGGFYQSWNEFVNGGMVPLPDKSTTVTANGEGVHLHGSDADTVFDDEFDKNMLLLSSHVVTKDLDNTAYPTYEASSDGLRINNVHNILHQPPTAPARDISMQVSYAPVGNFQLPATLRVTIVGVGYFDFTFSNYTLTTK